MGISLTVDSADRDEFGMLHVPQGCLVTLEGEVHEDVVIGDLS